MSIIESGTKRGVVNKTLKEDNLNSKLISIFLLGVLISGFFVSVIASIGVVSADDGVIKELWDTLFGGLFDGSGDYEASKQLISKILLGFLLALIVYSLSDYIPFLPKGYREENIKWMFAIVVAVLGFLFVDPKVIISIASTFEWMGIVITSVIPLIIIMVFTYKMRDNHPGMANIVNKFVIGGFIVAMLFNLSKLDDPTYRSVYLVTIIVAAVWFFIERRFYFKAIMAGIKGDIEESSRYLQSAISAEIERIDRELETATGEKTIEMLKERRKKLQDKLYAIQEFVSKG